MALDVRNEPTRRSNGVQRKGLLTSLMTLAMLALMTVPVQAQTGQVTGRVLDAQSGGPLSEVQVYIPGLQLGALSRADGRFLILNVPAGTHELVAERIGLSSATESITVAAGSTVTIDFSLESAALGLDEIVVTGAAGSARRREIGNSITQLNISEVRDRPADVSTLLQGSAPGIEITGGTSSLGGGKQIRLRGNSSVGMSNQPIIYVDGVRMMDGGFPRVGTPGMVQGRGARLTASPLDNINPNDIDRIEVIKGSAATTLFGTEASAGVIQIFTKRGSTGAPVWTAEMQQGTGWAKQYGANGLNYMNMEHFFRAPWWGAGYDGGEFGRDCVVDNAPDNPDSSFDETQNNSVWQGANSSLEGNCRYPGAQWYQTYNMSVRGGGQGLQYFLSGAYQDDTGMLPLDEGEKYNLQANFTMSPTDDIQIQWSTGLTRQWFQNTPSGNNLSGLELQVMRQERNYLSNGDPRELAKLLDYDFQRWIERVTTGVTVNYTPMTDLTNRFTVGYDYNQQEVRNLMPIGFWELPEGSVVADVFQKRLLTFDYVGSYRFPITETIRSNFSWGGQAIGDDLRQVTASGQNFPGAVEPTVSSAAVRLSEESREKVWNAGFFFQNVFDISDRYFLTFGVRVDGNSAFGEGFGLQTYPKVSGTWVISDEAFWPESFGSIKLRSAYGQSGRAPGTFDAVRTWNPVGFIGRPAFQPDNRGNPNLGPEVTSEFEVGFDGSWMNDRLSATFTYFSQKTTDALMDVSAIPSLGFGSSQLENVGELENKGIELQLDGTVVQGADWGVDLGLGISTNYSKVLSLGGNEPFNALSGRIIEGHSVPVGFDRRVANPDEIGNGFTTDEYLNDGENVVIAPIFPTHFVTPTLSVRTPGNITLSARGEYRGGNMVEISPIPVGRSVRSPLCFPYYTDPQNDITLRENIPAIWRERCSTSFNDDYWFDADYFKLRSVSATIPVDFAFPDRISNATLTMVVANAYDWYREIPWYDVELVPDNGIGQEGFGNASERSPAPATLRISLRVTF
ncbi:MAG: TonB-dependent receptor [Gemmatimonadota bacterium]